MLKRVYSEHEWVPWKFIKFPIEALRDSEIAQKALSEIESKLKIKDVEGWYEISLRDLRKVGVYPIVQSAGGLYKFLKLYRPTWTGKSSDSLGPRTSRQTMK